MCSVSLTKWVGQRVNDALLSRGFEIVCSERLYGWQHMQTHQERFNAAPLAEDAKSYLRPDNPKLLDLEKDTVRLMLG